MIALLLSEPAVENDALERRLQASSGPVCAGFCDANYYAVGRNIWNISPISA
jgi:hypothetical protein